MPSTAEYSKFTDNNKVSPIVGNVLTGSDDAAEVSGDYIDMRDFDSITAIVEKTLATNASTIAIWASALADGSSPVIIRAAITGPAAVGARVAVEVGATELTPLGDDLRFVAAIINGTVSDETSTVYIQSEAHRAHQALLLS